MFFILKVIILMSLFTVFSYNKHIFTIWDKVQFASLSFKKVRIHYLVVVIILFFSWPTGVIFLVLLTLYSMIKPIIKRKRNKSLIEFYGYKIFKYLMNQISSGIRISESIKYMYRVVEDSELRQCLIEISAHYSRTSDISLSLNILREAYKGLEVDTLCLAIEQGLYTGTNYETLKKLEALLFKRYINQIKLETGWRKKRSILSVLLLCTIMVLMIAVPVVINIMEAFNQIFLF